MNIDGVMRMNGCSSTRIKPVGESPPPKGTEALEIITSAPDVDDDDDRQSFDGRGSSSELAGVATQPTLIQQEEWLPITESRKGNLYFCIFHLLCSGIGFQALLLPVAFAQLTWLWGMWSLCIAFGWQLYTTWLLVQLHEVHTGARYSRYLELSIAAFGRNLGKLLVLFPVMYLSGGTCVMLIIIGSGTMKLLYRVICEYYNDHFCDPDALSTSEWFLIFVFLAIVIALFLPNLNSVAWVSLIGAVVAIAYCSLVSAMLVTKGRPLGVSESKADHVMSPLGALGIIALSFRGHNVVLEIQGTLPANLKFKTKIIMLKGVMMSYILISLFVFPLAICGFWAYGTSIPSGGIMNAFAHYHEHGRAKAMLGVFYFLVTINSLCTFQIYAMPAFDNLELRVTSISGKRCTRWERAALRMFFGGITLFIAVTFPFLPKLAIVVGGATLPLTFSYPCFMWIALRKPNAYSGMWWLNISLGCLGVLLAILVVASAIWNLVNNHFQGNFFHPK